MQQRFFGQEIADTIHATRREIQWWGEQGMLGPYDAPPATRKQPAYTTEHLYRAAVVKELRNRRIYLQEIRDHPEVFKHMPHREALLCLVTYTGRGKRPQRLLSFRWCMRSETALWALSQHQGPGHVILRSDITNRAYGFA